MDRLLYETHMHTPLCKHAQGDPGEYAAVAERRGLAGIIVTCHNPMPDGFGSHVRMAAHQFDGYVDLIEQTRRDWADRVDVRLGLECDWFPDYADFLAEQVDSAPFHYVLGSVHPQLPEFKDRFWRDDALAYQRHYFDQLAQAAESRLFDCLSHPDLVKNITPSRWDPGRVMDDIRRALDRIADTGVSMELNTSGLNKAVPEMNPGMTILREMRERGIGVVIGADAHVPERTGEDFDEALRLLADAGYEHVGYYLDRERREVRIEDALASLDGELNGEVASR